MKLMTFKKYITTLNFLKKNKKENISSTKAEITAFADKMASQSEGVFESGEEYLSYYGENAVKDEYLWSKVMEIVLAAAKAAE